MQPQQLYLAAMLPPKDRSVLYVREAAELLRVTEQHVIDLIAEGKLAAVDIAGRGHYVRASMDAMLAISARSGIPVDTLLEIVRTTKPSRVSSRSHYRIPVDAYRAFLGENHSFLPGSK